MIALNNNETLNELKKITRILLFGNAQAIESELSRIATTPERRQIWLLIDGQRSTSAIANRTNVTAKAVRNFLKQLETAGLVQYPRFQPPKKLIDYTPPDWLNLIDVTTDSE